MGWGMLQEYEGFHTHVIPFSKSVPALRKETQERQCFAECDIMASYFHFPSGTNGLVEVRIMVQGAGGDRQVVPYPQDTFIALDNTTLPVGNLQVALRRGDKIRVEWYNYDGGNAHRCPVEVMVREHGRLDRPVK